MKKLCFVWRAYVSDDEWPRAGVVGQPPQRGVQIRRCHIHLQKARVTAGKQGSTSCMQ